MTPGLDWRSEYAAWPVAAAKLAYCERTMAALRDRDPVVTSTELDEDVAEIAYSLDQYYRSPAIQPGELPPGIDGALRAIFEDLGSPRDPAETLQPAGGLIRRLEPELMANVFRWTGHFPERTRVLVRHLADRADRLQQGYAPGRETAAVIALTTLVTGLAMNYVTKGTYVP
jgi:hypothetical protein